VNIDTVKVVSASIAELNSIWSSALESQLADEVVA
jgi:hypothetical protein